MNKKRCIYYIPFHIDTNTKSGTNIRPIKMLEAFEKIGYEVDNVVGYAEDRKIKIKEIKENIKKGVKYDFLYTESSTMPTLLTEKNHLPLHPFFDFNFFNYCRKNGIKVGLFYRDMHWKFHFYNKNVSFIKRNFAKLFYKYDLYKYRKVIDVFYTSTFGYKKYLPKKLINNIEYKLLPPGCMSANYVEANNDKFTIFYVGGISDELYDFRLLFKVVSKIKDVKLIVCCREKDWENVKDKYEKYLNENILIIHKSGEELEEYYAKADVYALLYDYNSYRDICVPYKVFEYLAHNKPIIANSNTAVSEYIKENGIGFVVDYDEEKIKKLLIDLKNNPDKLKRIIDNQRNIIFKNTWKDRAFQVSNDLK